MSIAWLFNDLMSRDGLPIDITNDVYQTPLLCAMRAGGYGFAHELVDRGADPCTTSSRGESPLHWVLSLFDVGYSDMLKKIMDKGGLHSLTCWAQRCDYAASDLGSFN